MRFLRFSYIIPRILILVVLLAAAEIGSGYLIKWGMVSSAESALGAKVDVGSVKASVLSTQVSIDGVAVTNPKSPLKNLVEFDSLEVDLDSKALLRKSLIADYAVIRGLSFDTDRSTSGALPDAPEPSEGETSTPWLVPLAKEHGEAWLADIEQRISADLEIQFESVRLAEQLAERWPQAYQELEADAREIKAKAKQLEQDVRIAKQNPLRYAEVLTQLPGRIKAMEQSIRDLKSRVTAIPNQLAIDRQAVEAARAHDEQLVREKLKFDNIDSQKLTEYLLGESVAGPLHQTVSWVKWARQLVPPRGQKVVQVEARRGEDIQFDGVEQLPQMLLKAVRLDGTASMGGQPLELVGVLRDWTNEPQFHTKPTTLEFKTKGGLPLVVQATFDRTQDTPRDIILCEMSDLLLPAQSVGKAGKLQLAMQPSRASVVLNLKVSGDELEGQVEVAQSNLQITPQIAVGKLGNRLQSALAANLATVNQASSTVTLSGTIDKPAVVLHSSLGADLALAIKQSATEIVNVERDRLVARARQEADAHLAKLNEQYNSFQSKIASELEGPLQVVNSILGPSAETQIGSSPFDQLLK